MPACWMHGWPALLVLVLDMDCLLFYQLLFYKTIQIYTLWLYIKNVNEIIQDYMLSDSAATWIEKLSRFQYIQHIKYAVCTFCLYFNGFVALWGEAEVGKLLCIHKLTVQIHTIYLLNPFQLQFEANIQLQASLNRKDSQFKIASKCIFFNK